MTDKAEDSGTRQQDRLFWLLSLQEKNSVNEEPPFAWLYFGASRTCLRDKSGVRKQGKGKGKSGLLRNSLRKQQTFRDASAGFPREMTPEEQAQKFHTQFDNPSVGRSEYCFWSVDESNFQPIRSTTQIWVVTRHQYGISARFPQASVLKETSDVIAKCRLFSQSTSRNIIDLFTSK